MANNIQPDKNAAQLAGFNDYCKDHPTERFWQALRNYSGASKIIFEGEDKEQVDTFYWV